MDVRDVVASAQRACLRALELQRAAQETILQSGLVRSDRERAAREEALRREVAGLRASIASRAVIEQAKGIVIAATGCDADEAFALLVRQSQHENRKLREIAAELVAAKSHRRGTAVSCAAPRR